MKTIMWFRQDLRISDNPALLEAVSSGEIIPIYILDDIYSQSEKIGDASRVWLHYSLLELNRSLNFNLKLTAEQAEIQNHHVNSSADLHIHNDLGREHIIYNSLIYLNDNFDGGHFITKNGISIKPEKGMLTFFNGQKVYHGVKRVLKNDRKTIIFWWRK